MNLIINGNDLNTYGLSNLGRIYWNLAPAQLIEHALANDEGRLAANGAFCARTGTHTGRSPKDKFIVAHDSYKNRIWWGTNNHEMSAETFRMIRRSVADYLQGRNLYVLDAAAGADPRYRMPIRVVTELAWHNLFARQLFLRANEHDAESERPGFTILCVPHFYATPEVHNTRTQTAIIIDFQERLVLIAGTEYAGEMKKSIFTVLNFLLPSADVLPMHCAANVGSDGDVTLFFGLSGTGKTSLSADPTRPLIGDDEHGWGEQGIFNFEGGCYAKCISLSQTNEPQIWNAIRFGAVCENVVFNEQSREPDYNDATLTENTRAAYPIHYIANVILSGHANHASTLIFLTADSFGVLPPLAKLTPEQAMYYFLSGYTSKLAGTETGVTTPEATFSACFGGAFLPLHPTEYAYLLRERIKHHHVRCYLINTGWTGGPYGIGQRIEITATRAMVRAAISGEVEAVETVTDPVFGLQVPTQCPDVPQTILWPRSTWQDQSAYDQQVLLLATLFKENFRQFVQSAPDLQDAGPR